MKSVKTLSATAKWQSEVPGFIAGCVFILLSMAVPLDANTVVLQDDFDNSSGSFVNSAAIGSSGTAGTNTFVLSPEIGSAAVTSTQDDATIDSGIGGKGLWWYDNHPGFFALTYTPSVALTSGVPDLQFDFQMQAAGAGFNVGNPVLGINLYSGANWFFNLSFYSGGTVFSGDGGQEYTIPNVTTGLIYHFDISLNIATATATVTVSQDGTVLSTQNIPFGTGANAFQSSSGITGVEFQSGNTAFDYNNIYGNGISTSTEPFQGSYCVLQDIMLATAEPPAMPSILFCDPGALGGGFVDLDYLNQLYLAGYNVNYTTSLDNLSPSSPNYININNYNVLVIYTGPCAAYPTSLLTEAAFDTMIANYVAAGGGVLLMVPETNIGNPMVDQTLLAPWGLQFAMEQMTESNSNNIITPPPRLGAVSPLAYTNNINTSSPVTAGVTGIWYPYWMYYYSQATSPLILTTTSTTTWTPAVNATTTTTTSEDSWTGNTNIPNPTYFYPHDPTTAPPIFATATSGLGRIAVMDTLPQYSVGSGTAWLYQSDVLVNGYNGKPSNFGQLLLNTFNWLGQPSLTSHAVGYPPYATNPDNLYYPNYLPGLFAGQSGFAEELWTDATVQSTYGSPPSNVTMAKGLIGAKTTYSSGTSTVQQYATEAATLGLSFVVFADDYATLASNGKYAQLAADCATYSTSTLALFPGYNIETNVGNQVLMFGPASAEPPLPPASCLTGTELLLSPTTANWLDYSVAGLQFPTSLGNICYYNFTAAEAMGGMHMQALREDGMAAVKYYNKGALVEDLSTTDYLTTVASCAPPDAVVFNQVTSATGSTTKGSMAYEVAQNHPLTYVQVPTGNLATNLWTYGFSWSDIYSMPDIFLSNGPLVQSWPMASTTGSWAGEDFVCGRLLWPSLINVTAVSGTTLTDISIYNGTTLYRDFKPPANTTTYNNLLYLDDATQKNLVLIATDSKGNTAVTSYRSLVTVKGMEPLWTADRLNTGEPPLILFDHGPEFAFPVVAVPTVVNPGQTWDGGPPGYNPVAVINDSSPLLVSSLGTEDGYYFDQVPTLEFSDEGAVAVTSTRTNLFTTFTQSQIDPVISYGPTSASKQMTFVEQFRSWQIPTIGPRQESWGGFALRTGVQPTLYRDLITSKKAQTITSLVLLPNPTPAWPTGDQLFLVVSQSGVVQTVELDTLQTQGVYHLAVGDWFGVYSPTGTHNTQLFVNRTKPIVLYAGNSTGNPSSTWTTGSYPSWLSVSADQVAGVSFPANTTLTYELATYSYPLDTTAVGSQTELSNMVAYVNSSSSVTLLSGTTRATSPGLVDLSNTSYAPVSFTVAAPSGRPAMTLPVRVTGLNPNWSAGRYQISGYQRGDYVIQTAYSSLGIDSYGNAYVPVQLNVPNTAVPTTQVMAGHPVIADSAGTKLMIQVTKVSDNPAIWHVSVNNPTTSSITSTITNKMNLPGMTFTSQRITIAAGGYTVLE